MNSGMSRIVGGAVALLAIVMLWGSIFTVHQTKQAIVLQFGDYKRTITEAGLHFKLPFLEQVIYMEKRILGLDVRPQEVLTSDQKRLVVDSFTRFRIIDPLKTYQAAQTEARAASLLENIVISSALQVLAEQEMPAVVSGERSVLMRRISDISNEGASTLGLEVVDVRFRRVDLPEANSLDVFKRMRTERAKEAAEKRAAGQKQKVTIEATADRRVSEVLSKAERTSSIIRGEADGEAVRIFADAFGRDAEFFEFYRSMQAYRKALNNDDTTLVLSPDSEFFKFFDEAGKSRKK